TFSGRSVSMLRRILKSEPTSLLNVVSVTLALVLATAPIALSLRTESGKLTIEDVFKRPQSYHHQVVTLKGKLVSGHVGLFLEDDKSTIRIHLEKLPRWASHYVRIKDAVYERFEKIAETPETLRETLNLPKEVTVELTGAVSFLQKKSYYVY